MSNVEQGPSRVWRRLAACIVAVLLLLGALALQPEPEPGADASDRSVTKAPQALAESSAVAARSEPLELATDGLPIKPHDPRTAEPEGPMHPHPITAAHERIFRENNLVGALNLAVDLGDAPRLRELVAQYRAEYPEDDNRLQDGYAIIADCIDRSDDEIRARAQHFWETEIRSQTRRYVRRYCLDR